MHFKIFCFQVHLAEGTAVSNIEIPPIIPRGRPPGTVVLRTAMGVPLKVNPLSKSKKVKAEESEKSHARDRAKFVFLNFFIPGTHVENVRKLNFKIDLDYLSLLTDDDFTKIPDALTEIETKHLAVYFDDVIYFNYFDSLVEKKNCF